MNIAVNQGVKGISFQGYVSHRDFLRYFDNKFHMLEISRLNLRDSNYKKWVWSCTYSLD